VVHRTNRPRATKNENAELAKADSAFCACLWEFGEGASRLLPVRASRAADTGRRHHQMSSAILPALL
jgi:hypothetical protein